MLRGVIIFMVAVLVSACSSFSDNLQQAAQANFQRILANKFRQQLFNGVDSIISNLAVEGGFLDDPLVRIMLPPPLGLIIDVAQDLHADPRAGLLDALMNRAAENAIPVAGPMLKELIVGMDEETLTELMDSPSTAATAYLKDKGGPALKKALLPGITEALHVDGAVAIYDQLLKTHDQVNTIKEGIISIKEKTDAIQSVSPEQLPEYVAEQAVAGLLKKMSVKELEVRDALEQKKENPAELLEAMWKK